MPEIINKIDSLSHLISPRRDINNPIYNWHAFKHSYSKDLVDFFISEFKLKKGDWVLDPFCGGGTTLLACKQAGMNAHGFDILPFSVYLSNIKIGDYDVEMLHQIKSKFYQNGKPAKHIGTFPDILIIKKAFTPEIERELFQIKYEIEQISDTNARNFFKLALLSILESVSNTTKSGGFLRVVNREINPELIRKIFLDKISAMIKDVETFESDGSDKITIEAYNGDAREIPSDLLYDAVITSPPYPNRHDYTRIYSLEMIFDFINNNDELKKIRYETLRSHVEARKKYEAVGYTPPSILNELLCKVKSNGVNNPQVIDMLEGYFEDMFLVLSEMKRCLKKEGKIALVVSNVRFAGINIPVDEILFEIGEQAGLKQKNILLARYRGNSSQQMKTYERVPSRESIVIWEN